MPPKKKPVNSIPLAKARLSNYKRASLHEFKELINNATFTVGEHEFHSYEAAEKFSKAINKPIVTQKATLVNLYYDEYNRPVICSDNFKVTRLGHRIHLEPWDPNKEEELFKDKDVELLAVSEKWLTKCREYLTLQGELHEEWPL